MPSPSPNSTRKTSSSVGPRNLAGSTRGDLPSPTRGLLQGTGSSAASRSLYDKIDDHKENNTENGNCRAIQGRPNQNQRGASKKPWVTHFSKPTATLSPSSRVLVDRNLSPSSLKPGGVVQGYIGEGLGDQKVRATPPRERDEACETPGPVKGVAELSKRIQQFLEEQEVVLGIKTGSAQEVISSCALNPVELGQRSVSSPYNPYKSPFFERPKFLRLNGSGASSTLDVSSSTDVADATMEQTVEELPLFEGNQVLATPLQQVQFSNDLSPLSAEDEDVKANTEESQDQLSEATFDGASGGGLQEKLQLVSENKEDILHESLEKSDQGSLHIAEALAEALAVGAEHCENQSQVGDVEVETDHQKEEGVVKAKIQSTPGEPASQLQRKEDGAGETEYESQPRDTASQSQAGEMESPRGKQMDAGPDEGVQDMEEELLWSRRAGRVLFCGALLVSFIMFVLLSSAGPGLLPSALVNNPIHTSWHSSKYHENSMLFVSGMEGLWSTHSVYLPIDVRVSVGRIAKILHSFRRSWTQVHLELQVFAELTSSILDDWARVLMQQLSQRNDPSSDLEQEKRGRQFEWLQDYEFEEEWFDETPLLAYTDWELLYEYDLGAANQFVLGSIPEVLKHELRRNLSRLTDSPEVRGLLEDLMKLKGGNTEEDRLEVLQYFWEYTRFSASARETLMQSQVVHILGVENGSSHQATSLNLPVTDLSGEQFIGKTDFATDRHPPEKQSTDGPASCGQQQDSQPAHGKPNEQYLNEKAEAGSYISVTGVPGSLNLPEKQSTDMPDLSKAAALDRRLAEDSKLNKERESSAALFEKGGIDMKSSDVAFEVTWTSKQTQESDKVLSSIVPTVNENMEESTEERNGDLADVQPASDGKLDFAPLATLAIFVVASVFVLASSRRPKSATKLASSVSTSVQFLRKTDQPQGSLDGGKERQSFPVANQDKQPVTMIEELNDKFASVLQSPEPNLLPRQSLQIRRDEDLLRSPVPASTSSPYGSFTTYKLMQDQAGETKLTPVRRSSRIRSHISMSPQSNAVKRIAISPP